MNLSVAVADRQLHYLCPDRQDLRHRPYRPTSHLFSPPPITHNPPAPAPSRPCLLLVRPPSRPTATTSGMRASWTTHNTAPQQTQQQQVLLMVLMVLGPQAQGNSLALEQQQQQQVVVREVQGMKRGWRR